MRNKASSCLLTEVVYTLTFLGKRSYWFIFSSSHFQVVVPFPSYGIIFLFGPILATHNSLLTTQRFSKGEYVLRISGVICNAFPVIPSAGFQTCFALRNLTIFQRFFGKILMERIAERCRGYAPHYFALSSH